MNVNYSNKAGFIILFFLLFSCESKIELDNLIDKVEVIRDKFGINHIYASNQEDLFFMQGYLAAKDRLFQFEIWRRQATGTVSEVFGEEELERDIGTRLFKFRSNIIDELNHYHDDGFEIINSYVKGVNAYINEINSKPNDLPIEFKLLNIKPKRWTPEIVISRHQGLLGNIEEELNLGRAVTLIGEEKVNELVWFHPKQPSLKLDKIIREKDLKKDILRLYNEFRKPLKFNINHIEKKYRSGNLNKISYKHEEKNTLDNYSIGSNNWAISGEKSNNGYPILANDPHRSIAVPSLRYITHLVAPNWNVIGGGEPEIPGVSIGHNGYGAWGLTVFRTDAEDLCVYELNPNNKNEYKHDDKWVKFKTVSETINIKDANPKKVELKYTVHGPVTLIDSIDNRAFAVRCGWLEIGGSPYLASLRMDQAKNWEEFREACNYSNIPGENMVWADKYGNIGWQAVGIAPIRNNHSGMVPVSGNGKYEWGEYLPIIDKPNIHNPKYEFIATANENVTPDDYKQWNAIGFTWADPYRGNRINNVLKNNNNFTIDDMKNLQVDYFSIPAEILIKELSKIKIEESMIDFSNKLLNWNYILDKNSVEAGIYIQWEKEIMNYFYDKYVPEEVRNLLYVQLHTIIKKIKSLNNNEKTEFLNNTLLIAINKLKEKFGKDHTAWIYGQKDYKHVKIKHPLEDIVNDSIKKFLEFDTYPRSGNMFTPGSTGYYLNQSSGATFRVIIDTKDWDNSIATNSPGQSGNPESPFYNNLYESWSKDEYFKLLYSKKEVNSHLHNKTIYYPTK